MMREGLKPTDEVFHANTENLPVEAGKMQAEEKIDNEGGGKTENNRASLSNIMEPDQETADEILKVKEELIDQPEVADLLNLEYTKVIDKVSEDAEEVCSIYEEIFSEKKLDKKEVVKAMLEQANSLILDRIGKIKEVDKINKGRIIKEVIKNFEKQNNARKNEMEEFKRIAQELNGKYKLMYYGESLSDEKIKRAKTEEEKWEIEDKLEHEENFNRYDSERIKEMIEGIETTFEEYDSGKGFAAAAIRRYKEKEETGEKLNEIEKGFIEMYERNRVMEENLARDFNELLPFQIAFENKFDKLVYGHESAVLPKEILFNLEKEVSSVESEKIPEKKPLYFPVGISKDYPAWKEVFEGEAKMAKPIDIYGFVLWLNNQGKEAKLIVCDEVQKSNYQNLYGLSEKEALDGARKIGEKEKEFYKKIIDTFKLKNIEIVDYREFLAENGDKFSKYKNLCERLSENEIWAKVFSDMVQESVGGNVSQEERKKFLPYAIEELGWILATDGTKISHPNEARYDAIAAAIKNVESYAGKNGVDIYNPHNEEGLKPFINFAVKELRDKINHMKEKQRNKTGKDSLEFSYYKKFYDTLGEIKRVEKGRDMPNLAKIPFELNFCSSSAGSQSFGWRTSKKNAKEEIMRFKEPYSTYFYKDNAEIFLKGDQVEAVPKGKIGGKIQTMEQEKQVEYAKKVIKPILVQYFKSLENAPQDYFDKIKKTKESILSECKESMSVNDLLKFIQKYIIEPTVY